MRAIPALLCATVCTLAGGMCIASPGQAQPAPRASRPPFENLRFRENWSVAPSGDPLDPLKHMTLSDGGGAWLSLGGHLRVRGESVRHFLGGGTGTRTDAFLAVRAHLHADLHLGTHLRGFVEGRVADVAGRELPGGARPLDRNRGDLGNAFVELAGTLSGARTAARFGRQELLLGRERIISPLDWANVRRVFEGGNVEVRRGALAFTAFSVRPLVLRPLRRDIADDVTRLWGTTVAWQPARDGRVLESAVLVKSVRGVGATPQARRATATTRLVTPIVRSDLALEVEGGVQRVEGTGGATWATMFATDLTWSPARPGSPSVTIGLDRASGTRAGVPAQSGTWDQLYPLGHAYAGFADALGRRNLMEERIVTQFSPTPFVRIRTSAHAFQRASAADAAYDVAGGIFRSASATATSRDVGKEIDVALQWRLASHLRVDGGVARFTPGRFPHQTGSALRYSWIFSSITATF